MSRAPIVSFSEAQDCFAAIEAKLAANNLSIELAECLGPQSKQLCNYLLKNPRTLPPNRKKLHKGNIGMTVFWAFLSK